MTATLTRTRLLVALVAISTLVLTLAVAGGMVPGMFGDDSTDRPADPTTEDTVGYVNGYWYDDALPVDDRDDAVVDDGDELESVVYRSMARVEVIRELTFEGDVPVEVISREEFADDHDDVFLELSDDERLEQDVTYEALFMVDRDTNAGDELETMYSGAVGGYYDPETDQVVLVSDNTETPELDEVILGHELLHALQDQQFDLTSYDRETIDQDAAKNGLIEGDAVWVEDEYDHRCGAEWDCLTPGESHADQFGEVNWGLYMTLFQPYNDGPAYVDQLLEADDDWAAVNAAYDEPPTSSSTVIHTDTDREPVEITIDDRSSEDWDRLEVDGEPTTQTAGEAAMVSMFGADVHDRGQPSVIDSDALLTDDLSGYDYDQPYTDGWAGDELLLYVDADADDPEPADTGYVWETEWHSSEDAQQFLTGYLELLDIHDAEPVDDRQDTYVIDDEFPGAYAIEHDGETVTIVRAPSVDDLEGIAAGVAPEGEDTLERVAVDDNGDGDDTDDDNSDSLPGFAGPGAVFGISIWVLVARRKDGSVRGWIGRRTQMATLSEDSEQYMTPPSQR
ncbi:Hvo_1808 family surface protein [Natronorubrum bangense]|uniref:Lipoprotein n=2 Tax=Natronorubrum bangense TaxID=61858 RepID=L9WME4_9EURY|nr:Hvo_1808 family surface protein [Natronorubrum bangense]ELY50639.1 hypothetical protein C494_04650 [Natronorubrum bangense JCM 10635]QCC54461.1 hypothetical protein DV706_08150 [Natronorubrum bangense]